MRSTARCSTVWVAFPASCRRASRRSCHTPLLIGAGPVTVEGRPGPGDGSNVAIFRYVTPDYLNTLGVPLLSGRGFSDRDTGTPAVALVSERVTALFDGDPVGQRISFGQFGPASMTVVGVVGDIKGEGLDVPNTRGTVYVPAAQLDQIGFFSPRALAIRTTSNPAALVAAVQREIWAVNPNQTIANVRTLESIVEGQISGPQSADGALHRIRRAGALHGGAWRLRPALVRRDLAHA